MSTELVLGVAIAPTSLGLVLIRGRHSDGLLLDRDLIQTTAAAETAKSAILRTYSTAVKHGYRIRSVDVIHVGVDAAVVDDLVAALRQLGVRNVAGVDPTSTDSVAAIHALDVVGLPAQNIPITARRRHGDATSSTARRVALAAAVAGVLAAVAATVLVHTGSTDRPAPQAPPGTSAPATAVPAARSTVSTPRSVFIGSDAQPQSPATMSVIPASEAPPSQEPEDPVVPETTAAPVDPPPDGTAHLPGDEDGPRPPGPA